MHNTKIIEILKTFTEKEFIRLGEFVGSKFFNKNEQVIKLFINLRKHYPVFESEELEKKKLYEKIYGKQKYSDEKMRTLISVLMKLVKKFLAHYDLENKTYFSNILLLEQLRLRAQMNTFEYEYDKANAYIEKNLYKESEYYYASYRNNSEFFYAHSAGIGSVEDESKLINKISSDLEHYLLIEALDNNYQMLIRKIKLNYEPKYIFLDVIKNKIEKGDYSKTPLLLLKYYTFMAIEHRDKDEYFETGLKLYFENYEKISEFERGSIHLALINYCMLGITAGKEKYFAKMNVLYKFALENNLYFQRNKYLLPFLFNNIVKNILYTGDTKWAFKFISEYKSRVLPEYRKDVVNVSYARYYFEIKEFDAALRHINKIAPQNVTLKFEVLTLFLKIFYELNYTESVYSYIDSLKHFVKNNKAVLPEHFMMQANYLTKYMRKLMDAKEKKDKKEIDYLRKEIQRIDKFGLTNRKWILQKFEDALKLK